MEQKQRKVLLIEDDLTFLERWKSCLVSKGYFVLCAKTIEEALKAFPQHRWDAIVFDGCVGGDDFNSLPLIQKFRRESDPGCAMIAASSNEDLRAIMINGGCNHQAEKKEYVPGVVHAILRGMHV